MPTAFAPEQEVVRGKSFDGVRIFYRPGTVDEYVLDEQFNQYAFLSGVPEYHPHWGDVIIDVGAHIGAFSLLVASKVPLSKVYSIEPSKDNFRLLQINVMANQFDNVKIYNLALGERRGMISLFHNPEGNWGHSIIREFSGKSEIVLMDSLENFMGDNDIDRCDYLKMNCEGAEFPILLGAPANVLARIKVMLVYYHLDLASTHSYVELIDRLVKCGFVCSIRPENRFRGRIIAVNQFLAERTGQRIDLPLNTIRRRLRHLSFLIGRLNRSFLPRLMHFIPS